MRAIVFPGQGVHAPGMGQQLDEAQPSVFAEASKTLGVDVAELCRTGQAGQANLESTRWAQPAIVTCSVAAALILTEREVAVDAVAGHSLGEYSALVVAGSLSVSDGVRLVALRAEAMEHAAAQSPGGMAAVLGLERDVVEGLCAEHGTVVAGENAPGQLTISGPESALEQTMAAAKQVRGKPRRLNVAGAFHSPAMEAAVPHLSRALQEADVKPPRLRVWSPTTGRQVSTPDEIRSALVQQLVGPVLWRQTVERLVEAGTTSFIDVGPEKVVANLIRRIAPDAEVSTGVDACI